MTLCKNDDAIFEPIEIINQIRGQFKHESSEIFSFEYWKTWFQSNISFTESAPKLGQFPNQTIGL